MSLRRVRLDDAQDLYEATLAMAQDGRGMVIDLDECTLERTRGHIERFEALGYRALMLVAEVDGRVVGSADVRPIDCRRLRHVADFTMGLAPSAQGQGLGRALAERCVGWAEATGIRRLQLSMRADNLRARRLYESLGFVLESVRPDFIRDPDGFVDDLVMVRVSASGRSRSP